MKVQVLDWYRLLQSKRLKDSRKGNVIYNPVAHKINKNLNFVKIEINKVLDLVQA